ncbi:hypothetical protein AB6A40_008095 [Gnathostoma spinigerum]|uniref:Uncharacterized protein n=1 Tax=Gnathostoma spinigerum TaxID=75299 RepID=A0ABD6EV96_9BILA
MSSESEDHSFSGRKRKVNEEDEVNDIFVATGFLVNNTFDYIESMLKVGVRQASREHDKKRITVPDK